MKKYNHRHKDQMQKIIGIGLSIVGLLIFINSMPIRFLLLLVGVGLLLVGVLLFMK